MRLTDLARDRAARVAIDTGLTLQDVVDLLLRYSTDEELRRFLARAKVLDGELYARWQG